MFNAKIGGRGPHGAGGGRFAPAQHPQTAPPPGRVSARLHRGHAPLYFLRRYGSTMHALRSRHAIGGAEDVLGKLDGTRDAINDPARVMAG
jgi:hypothetical protein